VAVNLSFHRLTEYCFALFWKTFLIAGVPMTWSINVNGTLRRVDVDGDTPIEPQVRERTVTMRKRPCMTSMDRRSFLKVGAAVRGGIALTLALPSALRQGWAADFTASDFAPNAFIRISRDGVDKLAPEGPRNLRSRWGIPRGVKKERRRVPVSVTTDAISTIESINRIDQINRWEYRQ
jgi:hypothetical protein